MKFRRIADSKIPWLTLCAAAVMIALYWITRDEQNFALLVLNLRVPSELWRNLTAHWVHVDETHLIWNIFGLLVLGVLLEKKSRLEFVYALLAGTVAVDAWFFLFSQAPLYAGLSGVLNTLLVLVLINEWHESDGLWNRLLVAIIGVGALVKLGIELSSDSRLVPQSGWPSAPGAHLAGLLMGVGLKQILPTERMDPAH